MARRYGYCRCYSVFKAWIEARGGKGQFEERQAIEQVRRLIELHGRTKFAPPLSGIVEHGTECLGYLHCFGKDDNDQEWWITPEIWKDVFCQGINPVFAARALDNRGMR